LSKLENKLLLTVENTGAHRHKCAQILLPLSTNIEVRLGDEYFRIGTKELCFIPPETPHQCVCKNELIILNIPLSMIKKGDLPMLSRKKVLSIDSSMTKLTELIKSETVGSSTGVRYLYYYLYEKLVENNSLLSTKYIREHFDEPISIETLAALENYNPSYYNSWFKKHTGLTPLRYLKMYRIEKAKELLLHSPFCVLDIALQVGYTSHSAFSRAFKEEAGCTPIEFRAKLI